MPGIGVISNRNARLNRLNPKLKNRLAFMIGRGGDVASTASLDDAHKAIEEFKRVDIDMVAISGGDGTAHRTLEVMMEVYGDAKLPPILLLPTGTQNMVPRSFGIHDSGVATLALAVARYRHNIPMRCVKRNLLRVNGHYSFMFGLGIAPRFLEPYYGRGDTTPKGAAKLLAELAVDALRGGDVARRMTEPLEMEVQQDGGPALSREVHTVFCSFVEELALRFKVFPRSGWDANVFEVVMCHGPAGLMAKALPALWKGSTRSLKGLERSLARTLELRLEHPEPYTLDGDVYDPVDHFQISAGPELDLVVPGLKLRRMDGRLRYGKAGPWDMRFFV